MLTMTEARTAYLLDLQVELDLTPDTVAWVSALTDDETLAAVVRRMCGRLRGGRRMLRSHLNTMETLTEGELHPAVIAAAVLALSGRPHSCPTATIVTVPGSAADRQVRPRGLCVGLDDPNSDHPHDRAIVPAVVEEWVRTGVCSLPSSPA